MNTNPTSKTQLCKWLVLIATMTQPQGAFAQVKAVPTHCKPDERVVFSCPFKRGKTASLCASPDLTKTTGTLQYRYGVVGRKPELTFPDLEDRTVERNHPKNWFYWYSNSRWSTTNVPRGDSVNIHMTFTPVEDHPEINFVIDAEAGPESRYQGTKLTIYESGGQGRTIAEHRCISAKTTEDLFSLRDIIQK